ncbi:hypothetical protein GUJ93_ZPchr0002g24119 [Zizania palustris]|uniref:Uncharacterized protein n=1 Tax=Zizania palustris TaxID=103762 RepID=A0A8J5S0I5_ZIZPA|nr:hypothetical protein GUJ93_ZPchr0002g24119 [Zizania palustris]
MEEEKNSTEQMNTKGESRGWLGALVAWMAGAVRGASKRWPVSGKGLRHQRGGATLDGRSNVGDLPSALGVVGVKAVRVIAKVRAPQRRQSCQADLTDLGQGDQSVMMVTGQNCGSFGVRGAMVGTRQRRRQELSWLPRQTHVGARTSPPESPLIASIHPPI